MARYIDVEKVEYPYMSMSMWGVNSKDCKAYNEGVKATEDMITALPTADVEEVVRCKDCKHANDEGTICRYSVGRAVEPDDFCSYGERK